MQPIFVYVVKQISTYEIKHCELDNGVHQFDFQVDGSLFVAYGNQEINNANLRVSVELVKKTQELSLLLQGKGEIELQCDRCLDFFSHNIDANHEVSIHFAEETNFDTDEDYVYLSRSEETLNLSYFIYEMLMLSLPIRRVHPENENGETKCNPEVVKYISGESFITELVW